MSEPIKCPNCGGRACICQDYGRWAAHCMSCDFSLGAPGKYDPCFETKEEAILQWNASPPIQDTGE